jgi:hypothetical protein
MFAQLRKSATVTESLKSMIQAPILSLEVIKLLRIGVKEFSLWFSRSGLATGLPSQHLQSARIYGARTRAIKKSISRRLKNCPNGYASGPKRRAA